MQKINSTADLIYNKSAHKHNFVIYMKTLYPDKSSSTYETWFSDSLFAANNLDMKIDLYALSTGDLTPESYLAALKCHFDAKGMSSNQSRAYLISVARLQLYLFHHKYI